MPLPIALGLLAIGATGGPGIVKGVSAAYKNAEAEGIQSDAEQLEKICREELEGTKKATTKCIKKLGKTKLKIACREIRNFVDTFSKIKNIDLTDCKNLEEWKNVEFSDQDLKELQVLSKEAYDLVNGGLSGLGAAALVGIGAYKGVTAFALASTGTAISSLSGAAGVNATLAWFGGGAIAAGGLGMAGGTLILGGLISGPMLLAAGGVMEAKANKNLDTARINFAQAKQYCAEVKLAVSAMGVIAQTAAAMNNQLVQMDRELAAYIRKMRSILDVNDHWEQMDMQEKKVILLCVEYAQAVKQLLDLPLLGEDGLVSRQAKEAFGSSGKITQAGLLEWKKKNVDSRTEIMVLIDPVAQPEIVRELKIEKDRIQDYLILTILDQATNKTLRYGLIRREDME